jgi:lipid-A-disaccharide synthase-like uncharacterized protein
VEWIGCVGVAAFALAWIPQCVDTVKAGRCPVNRGFVLLAAVGSASLMAYAYLRGDRVFFVLNAMTTAGALVNAWYSVFGRA